MNNSKEQIIIVGKYKGFGGVQTIHKNLLRIYKELGYEVFLIDSIKKYINYLFKNKFYSVPKIVFFSGLSLVFSPFFKGNAKHIFFTHGFYIYEGIDNILRVVKKFIYEFSIKFLLGFYKWVICISPSPTSSLVNSVSFSKKVITIPWGVSDEFINFKFKTNTFKYHLVFLGRPNTQKLQISTIRKLVELFKSQEIISSTNEICFAFIVPNVNKHLKFIQDTLAEDYLCSIETFVALDNFKVAEILSQSLYSFNCYEWEAFGLSYIESLCMGCNVLLPITSPILPIIDHINDSPVFKFTNSEFLNHSIIENDLKLSKKRMTIKQINYYRKIFKWEFIVNQIHNLLNKEFY